MSNEPNQDLIAQATDAVRREQFGEALELAENLIRENPTGVDGWVIKGISLAQSGRPSEATTAFQAALAHNPSSAKAHYNFATHLYQQGMKTQALEYARQAVANEPDHASALDLIRLIESESAAAMPPPSSPSEAGMPYSRPPAADYHRPGYATATETLPFISKLGPTWNYIGWSCAILGLVFFLYSISLSLPYANELMSNMNSQKDMAPILEKMSKSVPAWLSVVDILLRICTVTYVVMDLIHRRGNFLWLALLIPCACCSMQWMTLPLYLALGRRSS